MNESRVVRASGPVIADVMIPPSKSIANRALICAALAGGDSLVHGVAPGDDTMAMLDCLGALGCLVELESRVPATLAIGAPTTTGRVVGLDGTIQAPSTTLPVRLAGTTSRFITALAALGNEAYTVDGEPPLRARPMGPLHNALSMLGVGVEPGEEPGHLPVTITGPPRRTDAIMIPGDVSSQYVTALMLIGPYLPGGLTLALTTPLISRPYVEITAAVMSAFGADAVDVGERRVAVRPGRYFATDYTVEPDASSASYPLAAVAIAGGAVCVRGLSSTALQGDARFADLLGAMGCSVTKGPDTTVLRHPDTPLRGIDVDMSDISDLVPSLAVVATQAVSPTRITGVGFIRNKESDRLGDLADELHRLGADVLVEDDGLTVRPHNEPLSPAALATHDDHRLAMAFGVLGLAVDGIEVLDPDVVSKSWPDYWAMLDAVTMG